LSRANAGHISSGARRRAASEATLVDVLDRVLEKGIVIDAWLRLYVAGVDLLTVEARVVVASLETYLKHTGPLRATGQASAPSRNSPVIGLARNGLAAPGKPPQH